MKKYLMMLVALLGLAACSQKKAEVAQEEAQPKVLVVYYSQTGATQQIAEQFQQALGADMEKLEVVTPYDGTYDETIQRCMKERESGEFPELKPIQANLADYDVIYLGYPVWFGTYALPMGSFIKNNDLSGKKLIPFCTFGSGGLNTSTDDLKKAQPNAEVLPGYGVRNARLAAAPAEIDYFLKSWGYVEGEVEALPDYLEQKPVTEEETVIFNAAVEGYSMLSATPLTVGARQTSKGTDYLFCAENGEEKTPIQVKVTVSNEEGAKPEFTEVIR